MSVKTQLVFSGYRSGRIVLHLSALLRDHKLVWHWKGISRELRLA